MNEIDLDIELKGLRLLVCDLVAVYELSGGFREMIPYMDLLEVNDPAERVQILSERVLQMKRSFNELISKEVEKELKEFFQKYAQ